MRKLAIILCLLLAVCAACRRNADPVVAQVYQYKLYASEVRQGMPVGLSQEDSLTLVRDYIDNWALPRKRRPRRTRVPFVALDASEV